jgi:hypothetical protein
MRNQIELEIAADRNKTIDRIVNDFLFVQEEKW